jgi:hypothetical protein
MPLRRSLLAPALMVLLLAGWTVLPGSSLLWTVLALLVVAFPAYAQIGRSLSSRVRGVPIRMHVAAEHVNVIASARQSLMSATLLPHQAWLMADAVLRTSWRLLVSRKRMLEWMTADRLAGLERTPLHVLRTMWTAPALADVFLLRHLTLALEVGDPSHLTKALTFEAVAEATIGGAFLLKRSDQLMARGQAICEARGVKYRCADQQRADPPIARIRLQLRPYGLPQPRGQKSVQRRVARRPFRR